VVARLRGTGREAGPQGAVNGVWPGVGGDGLLDYAQGRARADAKGRRGRGCCGHVAGQQHFDRQEVQRGVSLCAR